MVPGASRAAGARGAWTRQLDEREPAALKSLALAALRHGAPLVVLAARAPEAALVVARPREAGAPDLRAVLPALLEAARGKGGGGADLLSLVAADAAALDAAFARACAIEVGA